MLIDATAVLGASDAAETYLRTGNFALGGTPPAELLQSSEGERVVLNELRMHLECGPPVNVRLSARLSSAWPCLP